MDVDGYLSIDIAQQILLLKYRNVSSARLFDMFVIRERGSRVKNKEECGNCDFWMKTNRCPKEKGFEKNNGRPSISDYCKSFTPKILVL